MPGVVYGAPEIGDVPLINSNIRLCPRRFKFERRVLIKVELLPKLRVQGL